MPNPKRKISKARRDKRRTHWKITPVLSSDCPQCSKPKLPHQVCASCGFYNGRLVLTMKGE